MRFKNLSLPLIQDELGACLVHKQLAFLFPVVGTLRRWWRSSSIHHTDVPFPFAHVHHKPDSGHEGNPEGWEWWWTGRRCCRSADTSRSRNWRRTAVVHPPSDSHIAVLLSWPISLFGWSPAFPLSPWTDTPLVPQQKAIPLPSLVHRVYSVMPMWVSCRNSSPRDCCISAIVCLDWWRPGILLPWDTCS